MAKYDGKDLDNVRDSCCGFEGCWQKEEFEHFLG